MKLISVNVGKPRRVPWRGDSVATAIFKEPVDYAVQLWRLNLDGDRQADLTVHGGPDKAVYAYPSEHYEFWRRELPDTELPGGMFGENFTTEGLQEDTTCIGDRFRVGSAQLTVTQPRMPCYKLGIRFGRDDMIKRFLASGRTGFYFAVLEEGKARVGDTVELLHRDPNHVSVTDVVRLYVAKQPDPDLVRRTVAVAALPANWRSHFLQRLEEAG
ncbi:MAG: MOSC domain-containing protein [Acidobacteriia bacterium]|nr:MOSC domain-containing protein [Terriglobia bacterium]